MIPSNPNMALVFAWAAQTDPAMMSSDVPLETSPFDLSLAR